MPETAVLAFSSGISTAPLLVHLSIHRLNGSLYCFPVLFSIRGYDPQNSLGEVLAPLVTLFPYAIGDICHVALDGDHKVIIVSSLQDPRSSSQRPHANGDSQPIGKLNERRQLTQNRLTDGGLNPARTPPPWAYNLVCLVSRYHGERPKRITITLFPPFQGRIYLLFVS